MNLGAASAVTVAEARKRAGMLHADVKLGRDPAGEKAVTAARAGETVANALPRFLTRQRVRLRPRAYLEVERHLTVHAKKLHPQSLLGITRKDIAATLSALETTLSGATVNRVRSSLSSFFSWCLREGLLEVNPASFTDRRLEVSRARTLSDDELRVVWRALGDNAYGAIVRLLLLTGARREEIGALAWSEIDLAQALIVLPPARTKAKRVHEIPMTPLVMTTLQNRPRLTLADGSVCDHVFGRGVRGFNDWQGSKADLDKRIGDVIKAPWTLHDFRRVLSTTMHERLGVDPHIIEAVLGHVGHQRGVPGTYNKAVYREQKRNALCAWEKYIEALVSNGEPARLVALR
jgi:integrase